MNFMNCQVVEESEEIQVKVGSELTLKTAPDRQARYRPYVGRNLVLGIRPEHIHEKRGGHEAQHEVKVNFIEPLGMETMIYFNMQDAEFCGRVAPDANPVPGKALSLFFDQDKIHLIDPETELVI